MPTARLNQFDTHITRTRSLIGLGQSISSMTNGQVDPSDMFRSALVQAVASLDTYVHGVVIDFGVDIIVGRRPPGSKGKLGLHVGAIAEIVRASDPIECETLAKTHVVDRLSHETFQKPDDIGHVFALVGISRLWQRVFGDSAGAEKTALGVIVERRNKIVHECDLDPTDPSTINEISDADAIEAVDVIDRQVRAIDQAI